MSWDLNRSIPACRLSPARVAPGFVEYLDELGVAHAIVLGGLCTDAETARAHFVAQSLLDADEDQTLAQCIEAKHGALKASCVGGGAVREVRRRVAHDLHACCRHKSIGTTEGPLPSRGAGGVPCSSRVVCDSPG